MADLDLFRLDGRTALVTGGAGLYGRQIVHALASAGATTVMASRDTAALAKYAEELRTENLKVQVYELDQSKPESVERLKGRLITTLGV